MTEPLALDRIGTQAAAGGELATVRALLAEPPPRRSSVLPLLLASALAAAAALALAGSMILS